jgi:hypothetical protein
MPWFYWVGLYLILASIFAFAGRRDTGYPVVSSILVGLLWPFVVFVVICGP